MLLDGQRRVHVDAGVLLDQVDHRAPRPRRREVERQAFPLDLRRAEGGQRGGRGQLLGERHHVGVVGEGLVQLEHRELGVVPRRQALVAEHTGDLEHPVEAADDEPLQVQLGRDAQVQVHVERVVVRDERPGGGAAGDRVEDRRLDLDVAAVDEVLAHRGDRREPDLEDASRFVVAR